MSKENLALKLRVEVTTQTAGELDGQSRICNWLYNPHESGCDYYKNEECSRGRLAQRAVRSYGLKSH